jgi:hypothetical protein
VPVHRAAFFVRDIDRCSFCVFRGRESTQKLRPFQVDPQRSGGFSRDLLKAQPLPDTRTMEIRDGFIVGVYSYCDSWCDRCAFTSRCRVFADQREMEAALDPNLQPVALAPCLPERLDGVPSGLPERLDGVPSGLPERLDGVPSKHPLDIPPPPPPWLQELLEEIDEESRSPLPDNGPVRHELRVVPERDAIDDRAEAYSRRAREWLNTREFELSSQERDQGDPRDVIGWFHMMIHVKAMRALHGLAEDDPADRAWPPDYDGSAKVALLGIDRSHTAWLDLAEVGAISVSEAATFIDDLEWLRAALERTFPKARAFVRPAFDEPEEVSRLLRSESEAC